MSFAQVTGKILVIGFGSIGKGALPLILRHIRVEKHNVIVIDPKDDGNRALAESFGVRFKQIGLTRANYVQHLRELLLPQPPNTRSFVVNVSVEVSSKAITEFCIEHDMHYLDTVVEPWLGAYTDANLSMTERSNFGQRHDYMELLRRGFTTTTTTISCVGANPGLISWLLKDALLALARELGRDVETPSSRDGWAALMHELGVKGVHVAERDTQRRLEPKPIGVFVNTWSVNGFTSEGVQPSELGWGTHERAMPADAVQHCEMAIYLKRPGASTRIRSWTPIAGPQIAFLITHDEAISIAEYYTRKDDNGRVLFRPTAHYAYHPTDQAVLSINEMHANAWQPPQREHILTADEIIEGADCLGVLLYGHAKNAFWYGSELSIDETRKLAPHQNATALQVTAAIVASMVWALENPKRGVVDANFMDHKRCLEIATPYLGKVYGKFTEWKPTDNRGTLFPEQFDATDPWQFSNVLIWENKY